MPLPQLLSISSTPPHFGHFTGRLGSTRQDKNFGNLITEIQFSLSPDTWYFFLKFRQYRCRNCKKKYNMSGERENWISVMRLSKFLSYLYYQACPCPKCVLGGALEMETNCGNGIPKMGEKKNATSITFFTTNYKWLVVISSNLNLILRLLFCPNNNNQ